MLSNTKAIVLHSLKYGEQSLIVDMLTEVFGRTSFIIRIPKTSRGKLKKQFFQPLTLLDIELDYRPRMQLQHLRDARLSTAFVSIPFSPAKLSIAMFLSEFLIHATKNEAENSHLFEFVEKSIIYLDSVESGYANFHLIFMLRFSMFVGFYPNLDDADKDIFFDLREGSFTSMIPPHPDFLVQEEAKSIKLLMRLSYSTMHLFNITRAQRNRITEVILWYYRLHVPSFPELKSLPVLQSL